MKTKSLSIVIAFSLVTVTLLAQKVKAVKPPQPVEVVNNHLIYTSDSLGNRIPDFSYCGYKASEEPIPLVPAKVTVPVKQGDATYRIQSALDYVASLPLDKNGFRGAVVLQKGKYEVHGQLIINASGVVLRGSGMNDNGTQLIGAGTDRQTLIRIVGKDDRVRSAGIKITNAYVPVNAMRFSVTAATALKNGDHVMIQRPSTLSWINTIGTYHFGGGITALGWKPGERDLFFDRTITAVQGNTVTIDVPITTALGSIYGGGLMIPYEWNGRIDNIGIEGIQLRSSYNNLNSKDEAHRWMAITIENAEDVWCRQLSFYHFAGSAVDVLETARRVTIEDCKSLAPVSEIGGQRRYTFFTTGQQTLFQRCYAEEGYHDFATGYCAPGPNAFVQCESHLPYNFSGAIDSWASGILFDVINIDGNALRLGNRGQDGQGAGWAAANSVLWNCSAARIDCYKPPTAQNWAFGSWAQFAGDGYWAETNASINPRSFYYAQLSDRLQKNIESQAAILKIETEASSSPSVEVAAELTRQSVKPRMQLVEWIDLAEQRNSLQSSLKGIKTIDAIGVKPAANLSKAPSMQVVNGVLVRGNYLLTGRRQEVPWWNGGVQPQDLKTAKLAITRFVPGRTGKGLTDDLNELTDSMRAQNIIGMEQHYALWYERRRDDHERIRRMDGEVWPPFYELPFARTGKETAWDGLSKYDLTQYNTWYWSRLKEYANLADEKGLLLIHENYFQHNIIEAGAHYADFPWRTANNINNTGFPEPPPYAGDKRIFMAEQFYDVTNTARKELHKKYIWQCLDNFKGNNGVIQLIGEEFTGPLHFVKFWLDCIREWEKTNHQKQLIGLSTTKDVQDAILADPNYASLVDAIDIKYWHYQLDGTTYEPKGGQNLAPRQHARLLKPKRSSFEQVYRAVYEYRQRNPSKAVIYSGEGAEQFGWAVLMAGGSLPSIPLLPAGLLKDAATMKVMDPKESRQYVLSNNMQHFIVYANDTSAIQMKVTGVEKSFAVKWIQPATGKIIKEETVTADQLLSLSTPQKTVVAWIQ